MRCLFRKPALNRPLRVSYYEKILTAYCEPATACRSGAACKQSNQFGDRRVAVQAFVYINLVNGRLNIYVSMVNVVVR